MRSFRRFIRRFGNFILRRRDDERLREEIAEHVALQTEENLRAGMQPTEARRQALLKFGAAEAMKEDYRAERGFAFLDTLLQDVRFALRMLRKSPGFSAVAILTLALGIGPTTTIFTVVKAVLLDRLPYPHPDRLIVLDEYSAKSGNLTVAWPDFLDWQNKLKSFDSLAAYRNDQLTLIQGNQPVLLKVGEVSAPFFSILGAHVAAGRTFTPSEDTPAAPRVIVLSYGLWRTKFNADPSVVGTTLNLEGRACTIIGVLRPEFEFFSGGVDAYIPVGLHANDPMWLRRGYHPDLFVLGRLRDGVPISSARAELDTVMHQLARAYPKSNSHRQASLTNLYNERFGSVQAALWLAFAAVGCVLLIACVNIANLLVAHGSGRQKEIAIRLALGAPRRRILRQLIVESVLLGLIGGAVGFVACYFSLHPLLRFVPQNIPRLNEAKPDGIVLLVAILLSVLTGISFGILPALQVSRTDANSALQEESRSATVTRSKLRLRSILMVAEIAIALVLTIGAGLLIRSLRNVQRVNPGFAPDHLLAVDVTLPGTRYSDPASQRIFFTQAVDRLQQLGGIRSASAVVCPPMDRTCASSVDSVFGIFGETVPSRGEWPHTRFNIVVPGYLETMKIPLISGRAFTPADDRASRPVALINQTMARRWWPNGGALGSEIQEGAPEESKEPYRVIVGIVGDVRQAGLDVAPLPEVYLPAMQYPFAPWDSLQAMTFVVRTEGNPAAAASAVQANIQSLDKLLPISRIEPVEVDLAASLSARRFAVLLVGAFGVLALVLSAIGIYGVMAFSVTQRTHEIGIRVSLGAQRADVLRLVIGGGIRLALIGIGTGILLSFAITRVLANLLFGVGTADPLTFAGVSLLLLSVALAACYVPARRAMKVDPMVALRYE